MVRVEETCSNHAYPIKQKLREYGMMKNFMSSGSLTQGMEVDEVPNEGDAPPFPEEDTVMMIYNGRPLPGVRHMSNSSPGTPAHGGRGCRDVKTQIFQYLFRLTYVGIWICTLRPHQKQKKRQHT
jgi:hypothetical protein